MILERNERVSQVRVDVVVSRRTAQVAASKRIRRDSRRDNRLGRHRSTGINLESRRQRGDTQLALVLIGPEELERMRPVGGENVVYVLALVGDVDPRQVKITVDVRAGAAVFIGACQTRVVTGQMAECVSGRKLQV